MIRINLLPDEFRVRVRASAPLPALKIAVTVTGLFLAVTGLLYIDYLWVTAKQNRLAAEWGKVSPQSKELYKLQADVEGVLKKEKSFFENFTGAQRPLTGLLMWVSEYLPETVWLTELKLDRDDKGNHFFVKGLSYSTADRSSIEQIESYLNSLKVKMPDAVPKLAATRQTLGETELMNFVATFDWKETETA